MISFPGRSGSTATLRKARTLQFGKLTWVGLMIVALGWALLISGVSLVDLVNRFSGHASPALISLNMGVLAQSTILTGFGIAILGLLQTGFSALNRFFDSVLERTAKREETDRSPACVEPNVRPTTPAQMPSKPLPSQQMSSQQVSSQRKAAAVPKPRGKIVERGILKDRAYVLFGDGTIEIETLLGLRRFQSLREAAEFVG